MVADQSGRLPGGVRLWIFQANLIGKAECMQRQVLVILLAWPLIRDPRQRDVNTGHCIAGSYTFSPNFTGVGKFLGGLSDDQNLSPKQAVRATSWMVRGRLEQG